jgi:hypothetical protein
MLGKDSLSNTRGTSIFIERKIEHRLRILPFLRILYSRFLFQAIPTIHQFIRHLFNLDLLV